MFYCISSATVDLLSPKPISQFTKETEESAAHSECTQNALDNLEKTLTRFYKYRTDLAKYNHGR